ncbi:MAG: bifunctional diguanylate cyclase/phosphodiesterase, partial [Thermoleophilia bacterium]|nr:bifunctional diguanylate cyclase/phosphodiesterase [Thermoleophilia bacterium]
DLDDFKSVNDTWGHAAGDDLLLAASGRLRGAVRPSDLCARLGGDEFGILLEKADAERARAAAERLSLAFVEPFAFGGMTRIVRPSIGIAMAERGTTAEQLLRHADAAMYAAKDDEVRHVATYEADTHAVTQRRRALALELDRALRQHEIEPRFQPVVSLADGAIHAFESLVRWAHPVNGVMSPGEFLAVADNRQLAGIGTRMIREACRHASLWQDRGASHRPVGIWINLSAVDVASPTLVEDVAGALATFHVDPALVTLEITEHDVIIGEEEAIERLIALRETGVRIAIDDFGTGYSSLSRLGEFPLDMLKIPQPFVDRLVDDADDRKLVTAILGLAASLGLGVVAEGVEHETQAGILRELGCTLAQGYLYAPPLDGDYVIRLLESAMTLPPRHGFQWARLGQPGTSHRDVA